MNLESTAEQTFSTALDTESENKSVNNVNESMKTSTNLTENNNDDSALWKNIDDDFRIYILENGLNQKTNIRFTNSKTTYDHGQNDYGAFPKSEFHPYYTSDSKQSRLRRLKNGAPQGLVLAPLLFNNYTYDLPSMIFRKFTYADDLALLYSSGNWKELEETLSKDMSSLSAYLQTWRLKLSHTKTVTAAFHLNN